ncbi:MULTISPECIES: molybdate ABC transporter substrate-binding protein [Frankia]|nr:MULTISPECIES: molybdate ABC transporter substrate-binding protein [Frankia]
MAAPPGMAASSGIAGMGGHGMSGMGGMGGMAAASTAPGSVLVLAPGTLATVLPMVDKEFVHAHPAASVSPSFGHSPAQVIQVKQGSPGDVLLTVGAESMAEAKKDGLLAGDSTVFGRNRLEIIVPAGNRKGVHTLADLAKPGLTVVLPDESTPAGVYADRALAKAGVTVKPASKELGSPDVAQKVATGNADAGIAFVTDVKAGGSKVTGIDIPDADQVPAEYRAAVLKNAKHAAAAGMFVSFLSSPTAQQQFRQFGFLAP